jgi:hypothetical protein
MARTHAPLLLLAALLVVALAAAPAQATSSHQVWWNVSLEGRQQVSWSFSAERPEQCTSYYGTSSQSAQGSGSIDVRFASAKRRPGWVETHLAGGGRLRFSDFSTDGWQVPATWNKRGTFSLTNGKPCGSRDDEPVPLPVFSRTSGCGRKTLEVWPTMSWSAGRLALLGTFAHSSYDACPGVFEPAMSVDYDAECTPPKRASGIDGTAIQELRTPVAVSEFARGKAFTVEANHTFRCEFPSDWPDKAAAKVELKTSYELTFKPRRP